MRKQISIIKILLSLGICTAVMSCSKDINGQELSRPAQAEFVKLASSNGNPSLTDYELIWSDEFNGVGAFDSTKWIYAERGNVAWNRYMTNTTDYVSQNGSNLILRMDNAVIPGDPVPYHSGGIRSLGKFSMLYGKVEVRAKFTRGRGSWPAIWMMPVPETQHAGWPGGGEIDIMEHVNNENVVYHSIHNASVTGPSGGSSATKAAAFNTNDYNLYTMIWSPNAIQFFVNNVLQYTYSRSANGGWQQWPFDVPFYLILNQAGGLGWPGPITDADLPFSMQVDYVRVYKLPVFANGGFETGSLIPWTTWGGTATVGNTHVQSGTRSIKLAGSENAIEQVVTGLKPNTTYIYAGSGKVTTIGESVLLGVKNYGGNSVSTSFTTTSYQTKSVTFTTGGNNTSATLFFYKPASGIVYGDDFTLNEL